MIIRDIIQVQVHRIITISLGLSIQSIQTLTTVINLLLWVHIVILVNIVILFMRAVLPHRKTSETSKTKAKKTECLVPGSALNRGFDSRPRRWPARFWRTVTPRTPDDFWPGPILVFVLLLQALFSLLFAFSIYTPLSRSRRDGGQHHIKKSFFSYINHITQSSKCVRSCTSHYMHVRAKCRCARYGWSWSYLCI